MKILLDTSQNDHKRHHDLVVGQLLTPITRYALWGETFAIDNGAFSGFKEKEFRSLIKRHEEERKRCLFVTCPDVVGSAMRTIECFWHWHDILQPWPLALVAQDGVEDMEIPWNAIKAIFIGGSTEWKDGIHAANIVRAGKIMGKHVHIGRVNSPKRYRNFEKLGADTCDGSGIAKFDHMIEAIAMRDFSDQPLLT